MPFLPEELINFSWKGWNGLLGTANRDSAPNNLSVWEEYYPADVEVKPSQIMVEFDQIPIAPDLVTAQANAAAMPARIADYSLAANAIRLTPTVNQTAFFALSTYGDWTTRMQNWLMPQHYPLADATPSFGYQIRLWNGNPALGGTEIFPTTGKVGAFLAWTFSYGAGAIVIASNAVAALITDATQVYITGFQYIGPTGVSPVVSNAEIFTYPFTNETAITVPHNLGTRRLLCYIQDDGTNFFEITGLASNIRYPTINDIEITFASPTSGVVVVGRFDAETFFKRYDLQQSMTHEHAFNQNHGYGVYDPSTRSDLRYAMVQYTFDGPYQDTSRWAAIMGVTEYWQVAGLPRRHMQSFENSTLWIIPHNFNKREVFLSVQGVGLQAGFDIYSQAVSVQRTMNEVLISWATPQSGRVMIGTI
jgi:hypothetical protein